MSEVPPLYVVLSQIDGAKRELDAYPPNILDWYERCKETATALMPWLIGTAPELKVFVEEVLNSRALVRKAWEQIKCTLSGEFSAGQAEEMDRQLEREAILLEHAGGDITSKVVEKFLIANFPNGALESNGRSDYPDLFLRSNSYEGLPKFAKIKNKDFEYGAALKGSRNRPIRVPDGLEIKTCRERFAVDCHHAHAGLHLVVLYQTRSQVVEVTDILAAFMRYADYRITTPSTPATTLKASFNGRNFVSILAPS